MKNRSSEYKLLSGLFFRLLPYQILLLIITAVNGIVDSLYASNVIGQSAMSAIGLFGPLNHFLYAAGMMFVSGSQILYGRYLERSRSRINDLFTVTLAVSGVLGLLTAALLAVGVVSGASGLLVNTQPELRMLNDYILGQAIGIPALILGQQLFAFMSLENRRRWTMCSSIVCFAVNVLCDHLFIVSFSWGTFGLGFSTSVSEWVFLAVLAAYYLMGKSEWRFSLKGCSWQDAPRIVKHGFTKDTKRHSADIRVVHKADEMILRIRDDCVAFDPAEYHRIMQPDENGKNIGIRIVYGIAKEVKYQNLLGMNVLTMRI